MVLGDTAGATYIWISSLYTVRTATAARTLRRYGCGNVPQTTAKSSDTAPTHCAKHVQQSVDMSSQLPTMSCDVGKATEGLENELLRR